MDQGVTQVSKIKKNFSQNLFSKDSYKVILCEKSIERIPEPWKRFLDPDSGKESVF